MKKLLAIIVLGLWFSGNAYAEESAREERAKWLYAQELERQDKTKYHFEGRTSNGSQYTFDLRDKILHEITLVPNDAVGALELDVYEITELNKTRIIGEISYLQFMNDLGEKDYGGRKKFSRKYKKQIAEGKINCGCEDPIYKNFIIFFRTKVKK